MATTTSPHSGENEDDPDLNDAFPHDDNPSNQDASPADSKLTTQSLPMQKRRRVGRACDECRRKKIKCDGKQPCTHCTVYSYGAQFVSKSRLTFLPNHHLLSARHSHVANMVLKSARMTSLLTADAIQPRNMSKLLKPGCIRLRSFSVPFSPI